MKPNKVVSRLCWLAIFGLLVLALPVHAQEPVVRPAVEPAFIAAPTLPNAPDAPEAVVRYVDKSATGSNDGTSWANAYTDLQMALANSVSGTHLWIAEGRYTPHATDRTKSFVLKNGVSLYGGFPAGGGDGTIAARFPAGHPTILTGNINNTLLASDNSYHVVTAQNVTTEIVLDGVTIADGYADQGWPNNVAGGLFLENSIVTLRNCVIRNNFGKDGTPALRGQNGGAVALADCSVRDNSGGGQGAAFILFETPLTVDRTWFTGNTAGSFIGPIWLQNTTAYIRNTVILNNSSAEANSLAAINLTGTSSADIQHLTASGNNMAVIYADSGTSATVANSILWGNGSTEIVGSGSVLVDSSVVKGGYPGGTNISSADPRFVSSSDLRLSELSPARDSANRTACADEDIQGYPRPNGNGCDLGAYEMFTELGKCGVPSIAIPDNDPAGKDLRLDLPGTGRILDVNVYFQATHPHVGDLAASLILQGSGLTQNILHRPVNDTGSACGGENVDVRLDDSAIIPVDSLCATTPPAIGDRAAPSAPLALFNNTILTGLSTWVLNISDNAPGDIGTLQQWCIVVTTQDSRVVTRLDDPTPDGCRVGDCSLREAIITSNLNSQPDTIVFAVDGTFTLSQAGRGENGGLTGDLDITQPLTIIGNGTDKTIIDGSGIDRVFHIVGAGDVLLSDLTIQNGLMDPGAGVDGGGGLLRDGDGRTHLLRTMVRNNRAQTSAGGSGIGGGISSGFGGSLILEESAVYGNIADFYGGMENIDSQLDIRNSSVYSNSGEVQTIFNVANGANASLSVQNSTIAGNNGSLAIYTGANNSGLAATTTLQNSIIQASSDHCGVSASNGGTATVTSLGHNIAGDDTCNLTATGDQPNTDARLASPGYNGGPTPSLALLPGSPALDAGDDTACSVNDQRGLPRLDKDGNGDGGADNNPCDIGAYEAQSQPLRLGFTTSAATVNEGAGAITLTIGLDAPVTKSIYLLYSVYTDTASADDFGWFTGSQTVTIPAGQTSATLSIPITEDALDEPDEQFQVRITAWHVDNTLLLLQGQMTTTVTITDNDESNTAPIADTIQVNVPGTNIPIILTASDADGDPLTYTVVTQPSHGVLSGTLPNNLRYKPFPGFNGLDKFSFKVNDGKVDSNSAEVTILVSDNFALFLPSVTR